MLTNVGDWWQNFVTKIVGTGKLVTNNSSNRHFGVTNCCSSSSRSRTFLPATSMTEEWLFRTLPLSSLSANRWRSCFCRRVARPRGCDEPETGGFETGGSEAGGPEIGGSEIGGCSSWMASVQWIEICRRPINLTNRKIDSPISRIEGFYILIPMNLSRATEKPASSCLCAEEQNRMHLCPN